MRSAIDGQEGGAILRGEVTTRKKSTRKQKEKRGDDSLTSRISTGRSVAGPKEGGRGPGKKQKSTKKILIDLKDCIKLKIEVKNKGSSLRKKEEDERIHSWRRRLRH